MAADPADVRLLYLQCLDARGEGDVRGWGGARQVVVSEDGYFRIECDWIAIFPRAVLELTYAPDPLPRVSNGFFLVRGRQRGPEFVVDEVLRRISIVAPDGALLTTTWAPGAPHFSTRWERRAPDPGWPSPPPPPPPPAPVSAPLTEADLRRRPRYRPQRPRIDTGG